MEEDTAGDDIQAMDVDGDNSNSSHNQSVLVQIGNRDANRDSAREAAALIAARKRALSNKEMATTTARQVIGQLGLVDIRENNGIGLDATNINLSRIIPDEITLMNRSTEENIAYQRAGLMNSESVKSTVYNQQLLQTSSNTDSLLLKENAENNPNAKAKSYIKRKSLVTVDGGTPNLASQETKISGKIPQPLEKSTNMEYLDPELLPPPAKKSRLSETIPNELNKTVDASTFLVSGSEALPLYDFPGSLKSEKELAKADPLLGILNDISSGPIRHHFSGTVSLPNSNSSKLLASTSTTKNSSLGDHANNRTNVIVSNIHDAIVNVSGRGSLEENTNATIGNIPDISILAEDGIFKYFTAQLNFAKNKQSETSIGQLQQWQLHTNESGLPRDIKDGVSRPFENTNSWNIDSQLENLASSFIRNRATKEESHNISSTMDQSTIKSHFSQQLMRDYDMLFEHDSIYDDPSIDQETKNRLRVAGVCGKIDSKYVPGQKMGDEFYPNRVDPNKDKEAAQSLYNEALHNLSQRSIVYEQILREEREKAAKLESCYSTRTSKDAAVQNDDKNRNIPWIRREYITLFLHQWHPDQMRKMRQCRYKEKCICNTMAQTHRGLMYPSNRPTHGVLNGMTPFSMSIPATPNADIGRSAEANSSAGLFASYGFINVELLLPDEFTHFMQTDKLPEREAESCVLCHIREVSLHWHEVSSDLAGLKSGKSGEIQPINRFQVYVNEVGEYSSNACLSFSTGRGPSGIIGHFPQFLLDRYQYGTYIPLVGGSNRNKSNYMDIDIGGGGGGSTGEYSKNTTSGSQAIELQRIIERMMDFHQS